MTEFKSIPLNLINLGENVNLSSNFDRWKKNIKEDVFRISVFNNINYTGYWRYEYDNYPYNYLYSLGIESSSMAKFIITDSSSFHDQHFTEGIYYYNKIKSLIDELHRMDV
jgi:hypothetical protein